METISYEDKAKEIAKKNQMVFYVVGNSYKECYESAMQMAQWKDEQLIEYLTAFAQHLNKRGAFREDLCMDFEHEAQSFIEFQKYIAKQKEL